MTKTRAPSRSPRPEPRVQALLAQLVHDVGKYLARTARNLPAAASIDAALVAMLCRDLYGDPAGQRPARRFAELAAELLPLWPAAPLPAVAQSFTELDGLEADVRAGQPAAVARAAALAIHVDAALRALATPSPRPPKPRGR